MNILFTKHRKARDGIVRQFDISVDLKFLVVLPSARSDGIDDMPARLSHKLSIHLTAVSLTYVL